MSPRKPAADKSLPHNLEAEKSVLGAILVHNDAFDRVTEILHAQDFYLDAHRKIWTAIFALLDGRKVSADYLTVKEELSRTGELTAVGGAAYLSSLTDSVPRSTNVAHYAAIVKEKSTMRRIIDAANRTLTAAYAGDEPSTALLSQADKAFLELGRASAGQLVPLKDRYGAIFKRINYNVEHPGELRGVDTGFASINELMLGWEVGELNIVAARPSIGKTAFTSNSMLAAAKAGAKVAFFSLEMSREQLENKFVAILAGVDAKRIRTGVLGSIDMQRVGVAMSALETLPIYIDDRAGLTAVDIRAGCRRMRADHGVDLVAIDYVQMMPGLDRRQNRNEAVTDIALRLKDLAKELQVPVVLLSQLSRSNEKRDDRKPRLSDLRESGSLEQLAGNVAFLHRRNHREGGTTQFILEKQRNGPTGTVNLTFDRDLQTFTDGGDDPPEPPAEPKPARRPSSPGRSSRRRDE